jgi:hypothetical protein
MKLVAATLVLLALFALIFAAYLKAGAVVDFANQWFFC